MRPTLVVLELDVPLWYALLGLVCGLWDTYRRVRAGLWQPVSSLVVLATIALWPLVLLIEAIQSATAATRQPPPERGPPPEHVRLVFDTRANVRAVVREELTEAHAREIRAKGNTDADGPFEIIEYERKHT